MSNLADALLTAHVEHELSRLRGPAMDALLEERTLAVFRWLEDVKFNDIVTREQIVGVIERYVIELKVSGGITELAGQMSNVVFSSKSSATTRVEEVVRPGAYEDFADKIATLNGVQRELARFVIQSAAFGTLASRMLSRMVTDVLFRVEDARTGSRLKGFLSTLGGRLIPGFERRVGEALSRHVEKHAGHLTRDAENRLLEVLDPESVRRIADEIWDSIAKKPLSDAGTFFTPQDLEDFVVLGYEFWLKFRKTPYFHAVTVEVVDHLFAKYGDESVSSIIGDMGITEQMVIHELKTFLGPLLSHAFSTGFLEQEIRAHLEPFYRSPTFEKILPG